MPNLPLQTVQGKACRWLLDLRIGGSDYLYSTEGFEVVNRKGEVFTYRSGLGDLSVNISDQPTSIAIQLPGMDTNGVAWAKIAARAGISGLGALYGTFRRHYDDQFLEDAQVLVSGPCSTPTYGSIDEPLEFTLEKLPDASTQLFPPTSAVVDDTTWPVDEVMEPDPDAKGAVYPWIFGYPGLEGNGIPWGDTNTFVSPQASPAYVIEYSQHSNAYRTSKLLIAGHRILQTNVRIDDLSGGYGRTDMPNSIFEVSHKLDKRGRECAYVELAHAADAGNLGVQILPGNEYAVTFFPPTSGVGGGYPNQQRTGPMRGLGDILTLMLRQTGTKVDSGRMQGIISFLNEIHLDFALTDPVSPRAWFDAHYSQILPIVWLESEEGLYLQFLDFAAPAAAAVLDLVDFRSDSAGVQVTRSSQLTTGDYTSVVNDLSVQFSPTYGGDQLLRTSRFSASGPPNTAQYANRDVPNELPSRICSVSQSIYGWRPGSIELFHVAEESSAALIAAHYLQWKAIARRAIVVTGGPELETLGIGSIVTFTDLDLYLEKVPAIVTSMSLSLTDVELNLELLDNPLDAKRIS